MAGIERSDGNVEASEKLSNWAGLGKCDDDPPNICCNGACVYIHIGICRDMYRFSLWLWRRPNRIRRADEPKRDDCSPPHQVVRFSGHNYLTIERTKRHCPNQ